MCSFLVRGFGTHRAKHTDVAARRRCETSTQSRPKGGRRMWLLRRVTRTESTRRSSTGTCEHLRATLPLQPYQYHARVHTLYNPNQLLPSPYIHEKNMHTPTLLSHTSTLFYLLFHALEVQYCTSSWACPRNGCTLMTLAAACPLDSTPRPLSIGALGTSLTWGADLPSRSAIRTCSGPSPAGSSRSTERTTANMRCHATAMRNTTPLPMLLELGRQLRGR